MSQENSLNENKTAAIPSPVMDDSFINTTYKTLNARHSIIYEFVMLYNDYIYNTHDYGNGLPLTMIEIHTLTYIDDHPGTTVTILTDHWHKTKGAISQIVSRLEKDGLVTKSKREDNAKTVLLHTTELGHKLSSAHKLYDIMDISKTLGEIGQHCKPEEIDTFFKVMQVYYQVISKDFEENNILKRQGRRKKQEKEL